MAESFNTIFPHPVLTPINETPTQASLKILRQEIYANARAVHSLRGGGAHGHLALVISAAKYLALTVAAHGAPGTPFVVPLAPGAAPVHPAGATGNVITEINRQFAEDKREHALYLHTEAALKKLILQAVPRTFTEILCDDEMGYAEVKTLTIMEHLETTYGIITEDELEQNRKALYHPWDMNKPIEDVFTQIRVCMTYAAIKDPITEATAIRAGLEIFENTGQFAIGIREWRSKADNLKTLPNFRAHFTLADTERKRTATTKSAGYHQAAQVSSNASSKSSSSTIASADIPNYYYCWSHGLGHNPNHTSKTCINKAPKHNDSATLDSMCGGNAIIQRRRNDVQIFVRPQRSTTSGPRSTASGPPATIGTSISS